MQSAKYFGYRCDLSEVRDVLDHAVVGFATSQRVRLLVSRNGVIRVECHGYQPDTERASALVTLAREPVDPSDVFLFHKTTNRHQYERARLAGYDDVVLWNPQGQITEFTLGNVVVELRGRKVTPPVECGLLAGTFREQLLAEGAIEVAPVTIDELRQASRLWLVNSVRGWWEATLVDQNVGSLPSPTALARA
jgi:para-aminobenzoate synthetase/4-amino-4-deoxychorismate lyase